MDISCGNGRWLSIKCHACVKNVFGVNCYLRGCSCRFFPSFVEPFEEISLLEVLFPLSLVGILNGCVGLRLLIVFSFGSADGIDSSVKSGYGERTVCDESVRVTAMCGEGGMLGISIFIESVVRYY